MAAEIRTLCQADSLVSKALVSRESKEPLPHNFADKAIGIIETKLKEYNRLHRNPVKKTAKWFERTVYTFFAKLFSGTDIPNFRGCSHCEAILMAIIDRISKKDDLDFSLKACLP